MLISSTVQPASLTGSALRISSVLCRSVWLAEMTCQPAGRPAVSHRGPVSNRCVVSRSSTSPQI